MVKFVLSTVFLALCFAGNAQLVQVYSEVYYNPDLDPAVENYPSPNHKTYRIYAELQDPEDFVSSVYAIDGCYEVSIECGNSIWNSSFGGVTGETINSAFFATFPEMQYDSFVTIDKENSSSPGEPVLFVASCPNAGTWLDSFAVGAAAPDLQLCDGSVFVGNYALNGYAGEDLRVLLFQITTDQPLTWKLNLLILNEGIPAAPLYYVWDPATAGCSGNPDIDGSPFGLDSSIPLSIAFSDEPELPLMYPNPASDYVVLPIGFQRVEVYDMHGRLMKSALISDTNFDTLDVSELPDGTYLMIDTETLRRERLQILH